MKNKLLLSLAALTLGSSPLSAQTVNVPFSTQAAGKSMPIEWGMDAAWDWDYNVMRGIAHYGTNFTTGRISFQPYNLVDASKIDDASANFGLSAGQVRKLQWRIDLIKRTGATKVNINCDHEVLVRKMDDQGNYSDELGNDNVGKGNYVGTSRTDLYRTSAWVNLIKATTKYAQAQGLEVISVSPFNESDYGWSQYYNGGNGTNETNQNTYGIPAFKAIAQAIKEDSFFDGIRVCGGNTLNCDRASAWYEGLKPYVDEGNTHQLAGSFDNYANFFKMVREDGKVATADEVHNVGEAMVGVEYGMQNAIWWGFDSKARGQFMHDSNEGVRLAYAEDRSHWTSAAVYRNDQDGEIHGFIGSSERQANVSTYKFQCQDREVYFNGYGPQKEWSVTTVGGAANSYQNGQINYEYLFDITFGEDVQSTPVDGNYQIMSAVDMKLVTSNGYWADNNHLSASAQTNSNSQRWHIYPGRSDGDCSYWFIDNVGDATQHWNLLNGGGAAALEAGARVICYNANHDALEQWYLRYAKNGYFYIMARQNNKYLYNNNGTLSLQDALTSKTGANELKKYLWRLMPTDATAEQTAPATPANLAEGTVNATSASISWDAVSEANVTYNVLRQDANGWNTIARVQSATTYTDNNVEAGKGYRYKVQAVDYSGNRSEASDAITIIVPEEAGGDTPTFTAGQWEWVGENVEAGKKYYIYNIGIKEFLAANNASTSNAVNDFTFNTNGSNYNIQCSDGKYIRIYYTGSWTKTYYAVTNNSSADPTTLESSSSNNAAGTVYRLRSVQANNYRFYCTSSSNFKATSTSNEYNGDNAKFLLISPTQMSKYDKVSYYTNAFTTAKGYLSSDLSSELMTELTTTLDACDGTINYTNIETYITNLKTIIDKCKAYVEEHPSQPGDDRTDFTALIINPSIIQNGTTNDAPTGWKGATTNVTGNGHWTQGTGDTRLEAWNWSTNANGLNVNYYQDVIVPNGLYTLTAVTHQRANGDAALYAETYELLETSTTMPVGDDNEAETSMQSILVTDGTLRIGIKATNNYTGDNQWVTADNFTLTRVSTPEETALSNYTDAIVKLDELANEEFLRYVDHEELAAARTAAHNCEANASAYEKAINNYVAALKRAQGMEETSLNEGDDMSMLLTGSWIGATGSYDGGSERYNWDNPYQAGRILYQEITDLIPGGLYQIDFYAVANVARNLSSDNWGTGIAYLFANDVEEDINVINQAGCTLANYPRTLTCTADQEGKIAYGIANRKVGGQWYVAKEKSLTYLGMEHTANLSCNAGKYGTFVAPYDVTLPAGITAYSVGSVNGTTVNLTVEAEGGGTLSANTPVIIKNNTDAKITQVYTGMVASLNDVVAGALTGFLQSNRIIPYDAYVLQTQNGKQAFYKVGTTFHGSANRCYLNKAAANGDADVKAFTFSFDEEETALENIFADDSEEVTTSVYDLSGRKLDAKAGSKTLKRGIYIINGKKVMVK